ncbi:MAG: acyl-CoA synthetase [Alphaproteobacteria bacterium]|nr:acyl-CoA synthetase [Alphaproteobacteria bacterium]
MAGPRLKRKGRTSRTKGPVYWGTVIFATLAIGMVFALPTVLVIGMGLLPTFAALLVDVHPRKYAAWSVGLLNGSGLLPYLGQLWIKGHTLDGAFAVLSDVVAWLVVYSAAGAGWLIYMAMPTLGSVIIDIRSNSQIRRLKAEKQALIDEWGEAVAGESADG